MEANGSRYDKVIRFIDKYKLLTKKRTMFVLTVWLGGFGTLLHNNKRIKAYSKLGGSFLGLILRPCSSDAYSMVRSLQDQVTEIFRHPRRPSRYLALFVGGKRLVGPSFPFVKTLDQEESKQVFDALREASRIEVLWDEDDSCAKTRLKLLGLKVARRSVLDAGATNTLLVYQSGGPTILYKELLPPELEVFVFQGIPIEEVETHHNAQRLDEVGMFPCLKRLLVEGNLNRLEFTALDDFANSQALQHVNLGQLQQTYQGWRCTKERHDNELVRPYEPYWWE